MLQLIDIKKDYASAGSKVQALKGVSLRFRKNEFVSILGASGCGKTTLLNIIGGLDHYTSGDLIINGVSTKDYKDRDWDVYRNHRIGFVFQSYNLIPHQTVLGNVELALTIGGLSKSERKRRAKEALEKVGLKSELRKRPNQLSGGQMQRVAIARALVNNPEILLADEPTGALDTTTSVQIMDLIREIAGERLVIMVTHNPELAKEYSTRIVRLQDGLVIADSNPYTGEAGELQKEKQEKMLADLDLDGLSATQKRVKNVVACPYCGKENLAGTQEKVQDGVRVCAYCGKKFEVQRKARWIKPPVFKTDDIGATEKAKININAKKQKGKKGKKGRTSMSFGTSLGLSARNLLTKKGRTAMTSIAGSIGIISVCLVLALSNGFNQYIKQTEEDMLSANPISITETTFDISSIMTGMTSGRDMPSLDKIGDRVYVNSFLTNMAQGMTVTNNLSDEYLTYLENMDETLYTALVYDTGVQFENNLFTQVEVEGDTGTMEASLSLSTLKTFYTKKLTEQEEKYAALAPMVDYLGDIYGKIPGTLNPSDEDYGAYALSQYDVIAKAENSETGFPMTANEAVLVIGDNNDVTDLTLAQLGFIGEKEFLSLFPKAGEDVGDGEKYETMIDFSDILGKKFMLNYNDEVYTPATTGEYLYTYSGWRSADELVKGDGLEISIVGILRLKDGLNYGCLDSGLYFPEQTYATYLQANMQSQISTTIRKQAEVASTLQRYTVQLKALGDELTNLDQTAPDYTAQAQALQTQIQALGVEMQTYAIQNAMYFQRAAQNLEDYYIANEQEGVTTYYLYGDTAVRSVGGKDTVNGISIYTENFQTKEALLAYLDAWNNTHEKNDQVRYMDAVGLMMTMVEAMLNAITYVLVAFTAISLIVSSVMIGIITYVSVVERTKEIGVLRSLGARKKDIKNLFNAETFIIGLTSGLFGVAVTYLLSIPINILFGKLAGITTLAALPISSAVIMIVISVCLTLISGLIPAKAAAKKDPVIALRTE